MVDVYFNEDLENSKHNFSNLGWIPLYRQKNFKESETNIDIYQLIFCYLVSDGAVLKSVSNYLKDIDVTQDFLNIESDFEVLISQREFHLTNYNRIKYVNISDGLISYLCLLEECSSKNEREYYYIDDYGEKESVIKVNSQEILIKQRYLNEYLQYKKMNLCTYFRFEAEASLDNPFLDKIRYTKGGDAGEENKSHNYIHNNLIRPCFWGNLFQSWQTGKSIIRHTEIETDKKEVKYIVNVDMRTGKNIELSSQCCPKDDYQIVYFSKEVLEKYYMNEKYNISETRLQHEFFSMRMDNENKNFICVFLKDLNSLPDNEKEHWKKYNIAPNNETKLSNYFSSTMIYGCWNAPLEQLDLKFKSNFTEFNKNWKKKFSWDLFKPLNNIQQGCVSALHIPDKCNNLTFGNQIEFLALILVDSINVEELKKIITPDSQERSISLLDKFLFQYFDNNYEKKNEVIQYLRNLQRLRSGITPAHRYSDSNKDVKKALNYFSINNLNDDRQEGLKNMFNGAIELLNILTINIINK